MSFFTKFSLRNPFAVFLLCLLVTIGGLYSAGKFKQEQLPDIAFPMVGVTAVYPGASPEDVLNQVTIPLENALRNVEGVKNVYSMSSNSVASIQLEFSYSDDVKEKKALVEEALNTIHLPKEVERPKTFMASTSSQPILYTSILAKGSTTKEELDQYVKTKVIPTLEGIDGVASVERYGIRDDGTYILLDAEKMKEKHVTYQQVMQVLQANNLRLPLGEITLNQETSPVIANGNIATVDDLKQLPVAPGSPVTLADIATVQKGKDLTVISRTDGKPSVSINVLKLSDTNTVELSREIRKAYDDFKKEGKIDPVILYDRAVDVEQSVQTMAREGLLGALFASILILFFLRNIRATLIAIVSIPLSILVAMIALKTFTDVTLNIMTLGGMAVAVGRVVDDSIVVIENIVRRLQKERFSREILFSATKEVGAAITASTLTTVAVFAPLGMLQGLTGKFFAPFALTVAFSLLASLLVAFTVVPVMAYWLLKKQQPNDHGESVLSRNYKKVLRGALNRKGWVIALSLLLFLGSMPLFGAAGVTFLPETDFKYSFGYLEMPQGTPFSVLNKEAEKIDDFLREQPEVKSTQMTVGHNAFNPTGDQNNYADWFVLLKPDADIEAFVKRMNENVSVSSGSKFEMMSENSGGGISITVKGSVKEAIAEGTRQIVDAIQSVEGTEHVKSNLQEETKALEIQVDPKKALQQGLSVIQVSEMIRPVLSETKIGRIGEGKTSSDLYVSLTGQTLASKGDIEQLPLFTPLGKEIPLKDVATVKQVNLQSTLQLRNGEEYATVTGSITDEDKNKVNLAIAEKLEKLKLPNGVTYEMGGSNEDIQTMLSDMMMAMTVALIMVYVVMVVSLGGARAPFSILFSLPFAAVGGVLGTLIAGEPISISSLIGFLMLIGIVVTNAIVLIDRVEQQRRNGLTIREALIEAGGTRLRPILMTAIATIFALLPLALGFGEGTIISTGLAVVVIGGLITSTLLTLVIVPVMYELFFFKKSRRERMAQSSQVEDANTAV